jgi:hypothetical protein
MPNPGYKLIFTIGLGHLAPTPSPPSSHTAPSPPPSSPFPPSEPVPCREEFHSQVEDIHAQLEELHVDDPKSSECSSCVGIRGTMSIL